MSAASTRRGRDDADPRVLAGPDDRDDGPAARRRHAVGGHRVARPPQGRLAGVGDDHDVSSHGGPGEDLLHESAAVRSSAAFRPSVEYVDAAEQRRRAAVADGGDLAGLRLAAVEGAAELPGGRPPTASIEPQKSVVVAWYATSRSCPSSRPSADAVEPLTGELEVVALHVDRPGLVADDVDAVLDTGDQVVGAAVGRRDRAAATRWPSAGSGRDAASRRTSSRWNASSPSRGANARSSW